MGTDDLFSRRKGARKIRKENNRVIAPFRYLIICEGEETEPNYFSGIKRQIEVNYKDKVDVKNKMVLDIADSAIHRYQYNQKLDKYFSGKNINNGKYEKNMHDIFEILYEHGDLAQAIERSKMLYTYFIEQQIHLPAQMNPCTTVNVLVEELLPYMEQF